MFTDNGIKGFQLVKKKNRKKLAKDKRKSFDQGFEMAIHSARQLVLRDVRLRLEEMKEQGITVELPTSSLAITGIYGWHHDVAGIWARTYLASLWGPISDMKQPF